MTDRQVETILKNMKPHECGCNKCQGAGETFKECKRCAGSGDMMPYSDDGCAECDCTGEVSEGICTLCQGKIVITKALACIYEGYKQIIRHEPEWKGDEPGGVTCYSLAKYFRNRQLLQDKTVRIVGRVDVQEFSSNLVEFFDSQGNLLEHFTGFSWGYGGEGPNGLRCVLSDVWPNKRDFLTGTLPSLSQDSGFELQ